MIMIGALLGTVGSLGTLGEVRVRLRRRECDLRPRLLEGVVPFSSTVVLVVLLVVLVVLLVVLVVLLVVPLVVVSSSGSSCMIRGLTMTTMGSQTGS